MLYIDEIVKEISKTIILDKYNKVDNRRIVKSIINAYIDYLIKSLYSRGKFIIKGFGSFTVTKYFQGEKLNPFTKKIIEPKYINRVKFKINNKVKGELNEL